MATHWPQDAGNGAALDPVSIGALPRTGWRVRISDASPRGHSGRVAAVHADALTISRDDNGALELVIVSRRRVSVIESTPGEAR